MADKKDTKELIKDLFYLKVGAAASVAEYISDKTDEFIEKGKDVTQKGKDLNEELKHTVDDFFEDDKKSDTDKEDKKEKK